MAIFDKQSFMVARLKTLTAAAVAVCLVLLLSACEFGVDQRQPTSALQPNQSTVIGDGPIMVTMLLPLSAGGEAGKIARQMKNAATLAMSDVPNSQLKIVVKDTAGNGSKAGIAALQGINEGSRLIIGPLFSHSVNAASQVATQVGIPIIGFSTNTNVASPTTFLLSFLPQNDVKRIIGYAARSGITSMAALLPNNAYGNTVLASFRRLATEKNIRVVAIEQYDPSSDASMANKSAAIASLASGYSPQVSAIFMADKAARSIRVANYLRQNGVDTSQVRLLGTGVWDDPKISASSELAGAWFSAPDRTGFNSFAGRYLSVFFDQPERIVSLAYDATILANNLANSGNISSFAIANTNGFRGVDGVFRLLPNGWNEHGLAIMMVDASGGQVIDQAPQSF